MQVYALLDIGTQELEGKTNWEASVIGGFLSRTGTVSFTVQYFRAQIKLSQPLDTRKRATLEELDLELGNIQVRVHGAGTLDYLMEASVNILPNLLRFVMPCLGLVTVANMRLTFVFKATSVICHFHSN